MKTILFSLLMSVITTFSGISLAQENVDDWNEMISAEDLKLDLNLLYTKLASAHPDLYVHRTKTEYDEFHRQMLSNIDRPQSLFDTQVLFQKFASFGNIAHSKIDFPEQVFRDFRAKNGRIFPIFLRIVKGRSYVGENYSINSKVKVGDEILEINGVSVSDWLARLATNVSADTAYIAHSLLEFTFPKYLWLELGELDSYELLLKTAAGEPRLLSVLSRTQAEMQASSLKQPEYFSLNSDDRTSEVLDNKVAYLRPGPFYNIDDSTSVWDNASFIEFIDTAFIRFIKNGAEKLIIDLRANPGGDNSFSDHMLAWFADRPFRFASDFLIKSSDEAQASNQIRLDSNPDATESVSYLFAQKYADVPRGELFSFEIPYVQPNDAPRFRGEVYVLINRHSYSNAVNVAAIVQDYGFGTIVGEKTSDMATTFGAMETFRLRATGIPVSFPKAHIIRPSGDKRSDGVIPDWRLETPVIPSRGDVVLQALLLRLNSEK
jgi:C-terminal processing protease CtpA/Prc